MAAAIIQFLRNFGQNLLSKMRLLIDLRLLFKSGFYYSRYEKILSNLHFGFISIHATAFSITHAFSETPKRNIQFLPSITKHQNMKTNKTYVSQSSPSLFLHSSMHISRGIKQ